MRISSALRIGAIVLAVALTGSYVWFRAAHAQQRAGHQPGLKSGAVRVDAPAASAPTTSASPGLLPGSKSFILTVPAAADVAATAAPPAVAPPPPPTTRSRALFYGSKSAPVDLSPALNVAGHAEPSVILTNPALTTAPATQPAR